MNLIENLNRIKEVMGLIKEQSSITQTNLHQIPLGKNNFRSGELPLEVLKNTIKANKIKNIIRFNADGGDSKGLSVAEEKKICESLGCNFFLLDAENDQSKVNSILDKGYTLIHCRNGMDRTGGNVGGWLYSKGWGNTKKIWDYTTQYNHWEDELNKKRPCILCWDKDPSKGRRLVQARKFGVKSLEHALELMK